MGFANEVVEANKKSQLPGGSAPLEKLAEEKTATDGGAGPMEGIFNSGLHPEKKEENIAPPSEKVEEPKPEVKVTLNGKEFTSYEEAIKYAEEIARNQEIEEAYRQGRESAVPKKETTGPSFEEEMETLLFENPKEAVAKLKKHMRDEILGEINAEREQQQATQSAWQEFDSMYSDLKENHELVTYIVETNPDIARMPKAEAFPLIAQKARNMIKSHLDSTRHQEVLSRGPVETAESAVSVTANVPEKKEETALDFISQVNKARRKEI
jgi:hypothetical protein